jgi:hypothetical protein
MSYLLFMDESGHDRNTTPYEVRGGVALHARQLWEFIQAMRRSEEEAFGALLHEYGSEVKGSKLLNRERFRWAGQGPPLGDREARHHALAFLNSAREGRTPKQVEFTAYGQACLKLADEVFRLLRDHGAVVFASAIPRTAKKPSWTTDGQLLRKDHVFLLERFFYLLEEKQEDGLLVLDETEKRHDRRFMTLVRRCFTKTGVGRRRTQWIVPVPLFVSSDLAYPIQAADVCIYCINWGFRLPERGMRAATRPEIEERFAESLYQLQFKGDCYRGGHVFRTYGIVFVSDPYKSRGT